MRDPEFRHVYASDQTLMRIAFLVRALRTQEGHELSQEEFARAMSTTQSAVSRLEDPDYGRVTIATLLRAAAVFDLPLLVDFPEWPKWLAEMDDFSPVALKRSRFDHGECSSLAEQEEHGAHSQVSLYRAAHTVSQRLLQFEQQGSEVPSISSPTLSSPMFTYAAQGA